MDELKVLSVCGFMGYGFPEDSLLRGISKSPNVIGADNGSTDPGPYYLGSGQTLVKRPQMVRDLGLALTAAREVGVTLIIGSSGTSGSHPHVDSVL